MRAPSRALAWSALAHALLCVGTTGTARASGRPPLRFYEAPGHAQYWAVAQDPRGVLYFGTGDGLLEYDGASWRPFPLPLEGTVRSIAAAPDGTLYVGSQNDFGYFELRSDGERRFVSLLDEVAPEDREFNDVWKTNLTAEGVFFQSYSRIFRWRDGKLRSWKPSSPSASFHFSFVVHEKLFVLDQGAGLMRLDGDDLVPVPGGERCAGDRLYTLLELPSGMLVGLRDNGLLLYRDGSFSPFAPGVAAYLTEHRLYHAALLPDGGIALATLTGGLVVLSGDGALRQLLDRGSGLPSQKVSFVFVDREEALWLALDGGVARVDLLSPLTLYDASDDKAMVLSVAPAGARLYVGTTSGLRTGALDAPQLELVPLGGITSPVFDLLPFDGGVLAATNEGTYAISLRGAERLTTGTATSLSRSLADPDRFYVGEIAGARVLRHADGAWQDSGSIPGIAADVRSLMESDGRLWIGTKSQGLWRAELLIQGVTKDVITGATTVAASGGWEVRRFGAEQGLRGSVDVWRLGRRPVFLSREGVWRFDERTDRFERQSWPQLAPELAHRRPNFLFENEALRSVWVLSSAGDSRSGASNELHVFESGLESGDSPKPSTLGNELRRLRGVLFTTVGGDATGAWLGARRELVHFDPRRVPARRNLAATPPVCRLATSGETNGRDELYAGSGQVRIDCALPSFVDERSNEFRFRVSGAEPEWSAWSTTASRVLSRLPAGRLALQAQARDALGGTSESVPLPLVVAPRWHQLGYVRAAAMLALALLVGTAVAARLAALRKRQRHLEAVVAARTRELRASEVQYRRLFDNASDIIFAVDRDGTIRSISPAVEGVFGYAPAELHGTPLRELVQPAERERLDEFLIAAAAGRAAILEVVAKCKSVGASPRTLQLTARPLGEAGEARELEGIARDVTERRVLEEQFRQAQKMEAVGQLAGGVAHDFNNLLTVILMNCEVLLEEAAAPARESLLEVKSSAERAASLTKQLLAFSRRQRLKLEVLRLDEIVAELGTFLRRVLGANIAVTQSLAPELWSTRADRGQMNQVLMNLVVNARDAMPDGGELEIATANTTISDEEVAAALELPAGDYVLLTVSDTGLGMDPETQVRVFEPFFTTKEQGQGSGLGQSAVFGIVKQLGGSIELTSAPRRGTTFSIYLPRALDAANGEPSVEPGPPTPPAVRASVLVVEDETAIRNLVRLLLSRAGHEVAVAAAGDEAIALARGRPFDLLISDVVMPNLSGPEVARRIRELHPGIKLLFMTGYSTPSKLDPLLEGEVVLEKPFESRELVTAVRDLLAAPGVANE